MKFYMVNDDKHYVYILECSDGTYYTGYTNNLEKRLQMHQVGKGAKYTRGRTPVQLLFSDMYETKTDAMQEEYRIKQLSREQKEKYVFLKRMQAKETRIESKKERIVGEKATKKL